MIIESSVNTNTNTNKLVIETEGKTLRDIFDLEAVNDFFDGVLSDDYISTINGADAEAILSNLDSIEADPDMHIVVDLFGEVKEEEAVNKAGKAYIACGGGLGKKEVAIVDGKTTVSDIITPSVADYFATTPETLKNYKSYINDDPADMSSVLHDGDNVVLESRKAGDKGAEFHYTIVDENGDEKRFTLERDEEDMPTFEDVLDEAIERFNLPDITTILAIDDANVDDSLYDIILSGIAYSGAVVTVDVTFEDEEEEVAEAPVKGTVGAVKVFIQGSCQCKPMSIVSGVTTLADVVYSEKILNLGAMTKEQAKELIYMVNGVKATDHTVLNAGDEISMEARKAGSKGL